MKQVLRNILDNYLIKQNRIISKSFYNNVFKYNPQLKKPVEGEEVWLKKWKKYDSKLTPFSFRIFSQYICNNLDIVPLEICQTYIEPYLTPSQYMYFYSDKNSFDLLFPQGVLPKSYLRKIKGIWYDEKYNLVNNNEIVKLLGEIDCEGVIVKPTLSSSGRGVVKFSRKDNVFINGEGERLTLDFLNDNYKYDCIIQEAFVQHEFFSEFNKSSVNTIRIATYRDSTGEIRYLNSFVRIGSIGSVVDNAHAGGMFVGVSPNGHLGNYVCDQYGRTKSEFNEIDFNNNVFTIPCWDNIIEKVKEWSKYIIHCDLIAWDVVLDTKGIPHILEVNVGGYGGWAFQFTSGPMFGNYTDDVMKVVLKRKNNSQTSILFRKKQL